MFYYAAAWQGGRLRPLYITANTHSKAVVSVYFEARAQPVVLVFIKADMAAERGFVSPVKSP